MEPCSAHGCPITSTRLVRTRKGTLRVCETHERVLRDAGEIVNDDAPRSMPRPGLVDDAPVRPSPSRSAPVASRPRAAASPSPSPPSASPSSSSKPSSGIEKGGGASSKPCAWPGCGACAKVKGFCTTHYMRVKTSLRLDAATVDPATLPALWEVRKAAVSTKGTKVGHPDPRPEPSVSEPETTAPVAVQVDALAELRAAMPPSVTTPEGLAARLAPSPTTLAQTEAGNPCAQEMPDDDAGHDGTGPNCADQNGRAEPEPSISTPTSLVEAEARIAALVADMVRIRDYIANGGVTPYGTDMLTPEGADLISAYNTEDDAQTETDAHNERVLTGLVKERKDLHTDAEGLCAQVDRLCAQVETLSRVVEEVHHALDAIGAPDGASPADRILAKQLPVAVPASNVSRERVVFAAIVDSIEADVLDLATRVASDGAPKLERRSPLFRALRAIGGVTK